MIVIILIITRHEVARLEQLIIILQMRLWPPFSTILFWYVLDPLSLEEFIECVSIKGQKVIKGDHISSIFK